MIGALITRDVRRAIGGAAWLPVGFFLVVAKLECEFKSPAYYDDLLTLKTRIARMTPAKLEHEYELFRGTTLIAKARSILACLDRKGEVQRLTEELLYGEETP